MATNANLVLDQQEIDTLYAILKRTEWLGELREELAPHVKENLVATARNNLIRVDRP